MRENIEKLNRFMPPSLVGNGCDFFNSNNFLNLKK